jgi:hypothetical protein
MNDVAHLEKREGYHLARISRYCRACAWLRRWLPFIARRTASMSLIRGGSVKFSRWLWQHIFVAARRKPHGNGENASAQAGGERPLSAAGGRIKSTALGWLRRVRLAAWCAAASSWLSGEWR